jgi:ribosomal-protein-alanine N-acetyltransferase
MIADLESLHPVIRPLSWADLDRIMEIELETYPFPWTRGIFSDCIRVGYDCWGLQFGPRLIGYSIQTDAANEAHLLNLCIEPGWQRRGFGSMMLESALRIARSHGCNSMYLEVRPSNEAAIALYRSHGFVPVGTRRGYYSAGQAHDAGHGLRSEESREDALVMRL